MLLRHCILMLCCVMVIGLFTEAEAQGVEEVVYLKNGSVVRGIIVEQIPNETIRIRTRGGSEFVFQMSEVLKITKELPVVEPPGRLPPSPGQLPPNSYIRQKEPLIAFGLSFLVVGTGQLYVEEYNKAYTHWILAVVNIVLIVAATEDNYSVYDPDGDDIYGLIGIIGGLTNWVASMVSAPSQAHAFNERQRQNRAVSLIEDRLLLESYTGGKAQGAMLSLRF